MNSLSNIQNKKGLLIYDPWSLWNLWNLWNTGNILSPWDTKLIKLNNNHNRKFQNKNNVVVLLSKTKSMNKLNQKVNFLLPSSP